MNERLPELNAILDALSSQDEARSGEACATLHALSPTAQWELYTLAQNAPRSTLVHLPAVPRWQRILPWFRRRSPRSMEPRRTAHLLLYAMMETLSDPRFAPFLLHELCRVERLTEIEHQMQWSSPLGLHQTSLTEKVNTTLAGEHCRRKIQILEALSRTLTSYPLPHTMLFGTRERKGLCILLQEPWRDAALSLHALAILHKAGRHEDLPELEALAQREPTTESMRQVQEAARACCQAILRRLAHAEESKKLLRPAEMTAPRDLLRPAANIETSSEQLLRATKDGNASAS